MNILAKSTSLILFPNRFIFSTLFLFGKVNKPAKLVNLLLLAFIPRKLLNFFKSSISPVRLGVVSSQFFLLQCEQVEVLVELLKSR